MRYQDLSAEFIDGKERLRVEVRIAKSCSIPMFLIARRSRQEKEESADGFSSERESVCHHAIT